MSLIKPVEMLLAALGEKVEAFSCDGMRVTLGCALAAGLSIPIAWFGFLRISILWRINTPSWAFMLTVAIACVSCYMAAALLLVWAKVHEKAVGWVMAIILGSFVLAVFSDVWRNPEIWQFPVRDPFSVHLRDALERTIWLSIFTLPFAALVRYAGRIVRAVRRWHSGADYSLSITGK
ncbi:MAG TPA: hypothetical protein VIQ24_15605 [Pyrinomonadaceae bacterium]